DVAAEVRYHRALCLLDLGGLLLDQDRADDAETSYRKAVDILEKLTAELGKPRDLLGLSDGLTRLGTVLHATGRAPEAEKVPRRALDVQGEGPAGEAGTPNTREVVANIHYVLGSVLLQSGGRLREAEEAYRQAVALQEQLFREYPRIPDHRSALAHVLQNLG